MYKGFDWVQPDDGGWVAHIRQGFEIHAHAYICRGFEIHTHAYKNNENCSSIIKRSSFFVAYLVCEYTNKPVDTA